MINKVTKCYEDGCGKNGDRATWRQLECASLDCDCDAQANKIHTIMCYKLCPLVIITLFYISISSRRRDPTQ